MRSGRALAAFALLLCCEWLRLGLDTVELGFATVSKIIRAPPVPRRQVYDCAMIVLQAQAVNFRKRYSQRALLDAERLIFDDWSARPSRRFRGVYRTRTSKAWRAEIEDEDAAAEAVDRSLRSTQAEKATQLRWLNRCEDADYFDELWEDERAPSGTSSCFLGVTYHQPSGHFLARLGRRHLGLYEEEDEAARAFDKAPKADPILWNRSVEVIVLGRAQPTAGYCAAEKAEDDVVICCAVRTPLCKAKRGAFKDTAPELLLAAVFKEVVARTKVNPKDIGDIQIGNVLQPGASGLTSRMGQFIAELPYEIPLSTVNRQCSSSLQATATIAAFIKSGVIDVGLAGGVENMSMFPMMATIDITKLSKDVLDYPDAEACLLPMGLTSENVAAAYGIPRDRQDAMAADSHLKALEAQKNGWFKEEIVPVTIESKQKDGSVKKVVVDKDEGPRAGTTRESLAKLKPAFKAGGSTTAGNSSQVTDGAAMVLLARRSAAKKLGLPIVARFRSFACVGVDPKLMGIGPAFAIPPALEKAGLKVEDIDVYEINEAFASQATMSIDHLKIPMEKVNPKGGAIALGHPLGATGARQIATLLPELKRQNKKYGVTSMCLGSGMGAASVIELE
ncbi:unnamed protein product [Durusdinium trenchii]|uniref:acetyl-CoA C-acyltransferase n=1 Tax=Durusdinium trenchii TaxID=1381693 RepID=A0ABP0L635_9DINO